MGKQEDTKINLKVLENNKDHKQQVVRFCRKFADLHIRRLKP